MRRITLFTLLYLAWGVFLTVIALQQIGLTLHLALTLWASVCLTYGLAFLSIFPFWRQWLLRSQRKISSKPAWKQVCIHIIPWVVLALVIAIVIFNVMKQDWSATAIWQTCLGIPFIVLIIEQLFAKNQMKSGTNL